MKKALIIYGTTTGNAEIEFWGSLHRFDGAMVRYICRGYMGLLPDADHPWRLVGFPVQRFIGGAG